MKNIFIYYIIILAPMPFLIWLAEIHSNWFAILILLYIPYRFFTDGTRLVSKKVMTWSETWKLLVPWLYADYFRELYFKK
jgi:hypothetical protein